MAMTLMFIDAPHIRTYILISIGYFTIYKLISLKSVIQMKTNAFQLCGAELIECPQVNIHLIDSYGFRTQSDVPVNPMFFEPLQKCVIVFRFGTRRSFPSSSQVQVNKTYVETTVTNVFISLVAVARKWHCLYA